MNIGILVSFKPLNKPKTTTCNPSVIWNKAAIANKGIPMRIIAGVSMCVGDKNSINYGFGIIKNKSATAKTAINVNKITAIEASLRPE